MTEPSFDEIRNHTPGEPLDVDLVEEWCELLSVELGTDQEAVVAELKRVMSEKNREATRVLGSAYKAVDDGRPEEALRLLADALAKENAPFFVDIYRSEQEQIESS